MVFQRQIPDVSIDADINPRAGQQYDGGNFNIHTFIASENRGFFEVTYYHDDGHKPELEGRYLYELLGDFSMGDLKAGLTTKAHLSILQEKYVQAYQEAGLQESRLIKLNDDEPIEAKIAEILKQTPPINADEKAATYNANLKGMDVKF